MAIAYTDESLKVSLRVRSIEQIFDLRDPAPFREKDLDDDFAKYLLLAVRSHPNAREVQVDIVTSHFDQSRFSAQDLKNAIRSHFHFDVRLLTQEIQSLLTEGRISLVLGLLFIMVTEATAYLIRHQTGIVAESVREGLVVIGWVALWKPVNTFLYDWWPLSRRRNILKKLERAKVRMVNLSRTEVEEATAH